VPLPEHREIVVAFALLVRELLRRHQGIFCEACDLMGLHWTTSGEKTIYVSRKADVAVLDRFVGPKA